MFYSYEDAKQYVTNKDKTLTTFINTSLDKTQGIFTYKNLPHSLPQKELENTLQCNGHCLIFEHDKQLIGVTGGFTGVKDNYGRYQQYIISNEYLDIYKTFDIGDKCILYKNDYHCLGLLPLIKKYGVLLLDSEISLNTASILSRITLLLSAPDDKTKASAELFMKKILDGELSVIGENGFFDGIKLQTASTTNSNYITQLIELVQYYKASFLNEIGLNANYNMKRERLSQNEILLNVDNLLPFIENMYNERVESVDKINQMFGTDIEIDYNSVWKTTQEHAKKEEKVVDNEQTD